MLHANNISFTIWNAIPTTFFDVTHPDHENEGEYDNEVSGKYLEPVLHMRRSLDLCLEEKARLHCPVLVEEDDNNESRVGRGMKATAAKRHRVW